MAQRVYGNRWEVIRSLSEGGQARTFVVVDRKGDRATEYVLKRIKNIGRVDRFRTEIEAARNLHHENILSIIDFDLDTEKPYHVTSLCEGGSLAAAKRFWSKSLVKALEIFEQICKGVSFAHENRIIHRDLKPENIFLQKPEGPIVVGDFGICFMEDGERFTLTGEVVGPRSYIAPELEDGRIDIPLPSSDVYSLGKLLYWLVSDGKIFSREKHRDNEFNLRSLLNDVYLEYINRLLDKMITNPPADRYESASIVLSEVRKILRLVKAGFIPISPDINQPCRFCGQGTYMVTGKAHGEMFNNHLAQISPDRYKCLVCDHCGHVSSFNVEIAKMKAWWGVKVSN